MYVNKGGGVGAIRGGGRHSVPLGMSMVTLTHATFSLHWHKWRFWIIDNGVPERVGASIEAGVWRSQLLCIPHSETLSCCPTWQCIFCVGNN